MDLNQVNKELDTEREALLSEAQASDRNPMQEQVAETPTETQPAVKVNDDLTPVKDSKAVVEKESKLETEPEAKEDPLAQPEITKDKSEARLEKTWTAVNKRKTELDALEIKIKEREAKLEELSKTSYERALREVEAKYSEENPFMIMLEPKDLDSQADNLDKQAQALREDGDYEGAKKLDIQANDLRKTAREFDAKRVSLENNKKLKAQYMESIKVHQAKVREQVLAEFPEAQDPNSELSKYLREVTKDPRLNEFISNPELSKGNGDWYHIQLANLLMKAESVSNLENQIKQLKEENKKLNKTLTPSESFVSDHKGKSLEDLPLEDQGRALRAQLMGS